MEEIGRQFSLTERIVRSRMIWACHLVRVEEGQVTWYGWRRARSLGAGGGGPGHVVRVEEGRLPKQTETVREPGRRKGGRLQLRWEDCVKRDIRKAEEDVGFGGCRVEGEDCC